MAAALERHRENGGSCFDTTGKCTWADVLDEMSRAEKEYEYFAKGRGSKNIGRRAFRKAGDYASAVSPWLNLIPDDDGMNVLSGGLRLVFQVRSYLANWQKLQLNKLSRSPENRPRPEKRS